MAGLKEELVAQRAKLFGSNCALNYSKNPLVVLRGEKQWLYDEFGIAYLDCVNNVCHVGHCHPGVVKAASTQLATLQTNSRYLHPHIINYSKRLVETFPGDLKVVYWVNSGSEANDLALRLARAHTRKRGVLCVDGAYHGHVTSIIDISPYKYDREGGAGERQHVRRAAIPDAFSGIYRGAVADEAVGAAYAAEALSHLDHFRALEAAEARARGGVSASAASAASSTSSAPPLPFGVELDGCTSGCGAFICESILSCGGQVVPPAGYFRRVYAGIRAAGGVCIADEVQVGFGRVGSHMWAFELQGVVPDIVTLGKPMGNGFPVAAVVTTPAIAASFVGMEYFNTFAGSPTAGAVALAVLDAIQEGGLQAHAAAVGAVLSEGFARLAATFPRLIGSARGVGLMQGLEILRPGFDPREPMSRREPWSEAATAIVYEMRARRILLSVDGMSNNVIKLKPPMVFTAVDAARVLRELEDVIRGLDLSALLAGSKPPAYVHAARPLPASAVAAAAAAATATAPAPSSHATTHPGSTRVLLTSFGAHGSSNSHSSSSSTLGDGGGSATPVLRTRLPASLSPASGAGAAVGSAGEKRRREEAEAGHAAHASAWEPEGGRSGGEGAGLQQAGDGLGAVLSLLGAIRGEVASLSTRMAALEGAARR